MLNRALLNLRDAALADSQARGDILCRHARPEKDDDHALAGRQTVDGGLDSNFEKLIAIASSRRAYFVRSAAFPREAVEAHDGARIGGSRESAILVDGYSQLRRQLFVGGLPGISALELRLRSVTLPLKLTDRSGQRIKLPEIVDDGASNPVFGKRLEFEVATVIESIDRLHQSDRSGGYQIFERHIGRAPPVNPVGQRPYLRQMIEDDLLPRLKRSD
jgi:hypothetical protein